EQDEDNIYVASCPSLQGCYAQGDSFEEAIENIKDVIKMCLKELKDEKKKIEIECPEMIALKRVEVAV
ncbi:hypothetical protein CO111_01000, partial [Candidatus Desantisbacteria bacterium CG_4_9_14_3_um_filter_50_7]